MYYVNGAALSVDMMYELLFLYDLEHAGISYNNKWVKLHRFVKKELVEQVFTEDEISYKLTPQARSIIKQLIK
jgi:hypothetical protein